MAAASKKMQLVAIGTIETPYNCLDDCPRNVGQTDDQCHILLFEQYRPGLDGLQPGQAVELLYWLDHANFTELIQTSRKDGQRKGLFALRTPNRPNPIGTAVVRIESITVTGLIVRGLDCLTGTPLLDIKPGYKG